MAKGQTRQTIWNGRRSASIRADAPALGQHTDEVLGELLGLDSNQLSMLRGQGVVG